MTGIIVKAISGFYYVYCDGEVYECKARGNFRKNGISPTVGDSVEFTVSSNNKGIVEAVNERRNLLLRPTLANLDKLFIVSSYSVPSPDSLLIDRLTAHAVFHNIQPIIVFNKSDLGSFETWQRLYEKTGFKTYVVCAVTGEGIDNIRQEIEGCVSAFAGNSGVGKSSILNAVFGDISLKTGEVSEKLGRGRHTTRHTELYRHSLNGFVADTPGFSSLNGDNSSYEFKTRLAECFPEFSGFLYSCKFSSCTHTCEKGCAVIEAVGNGNIGKSRHESYCKMFDELKDLNEWNNHNFNNRVGY